MHRDLYLDGDIYYCRVRGFDPKTGKRVAPRKSTGVHKDEPNAEQRALDIRTRMIVAADRNAGKTQPSKTLAEAVEERREAMRVAGRSDGTKERFENCVVHLFARFGKTKAVDEIDRAALRKYADGRLREAASDTVRRELADLRASIKEAGFVPPPMPDLPPPKYRDRWTSGVEVAKICDGLGPHRARIVQLINQTGCRKNEIYFLRRTAPGVGVIVKPKKPRPDGKRLKTGGRVIALTPLAEQLLAQGPIPSWNNALRDLKAAAARAGLGKVTWNDLRAGTATQLMRAGIPLTKIAQQLGHKSVRMLEQKYAQTKNAGVSPTDLAALSQE
jgi:integrase